jgi:2-dehydro-3-deoxygalactonokinase
MNSEIWIALDGGTTNTRASLVIDGKIVDEAKIDAGVRDTSVEGDNPVKAAVRACLARLSGKLGTDASNAQCIASGMLGSEAGLIDLPHVFAPASANDLAKGSIVWRDPSNDRFAIRILPGVRTGPDPTGKTPLQGKLAQDIMRGEETQAWGVRLALESRRPEIVSRPWLLLWTGSHTKLIALDERGTILGSFTTLAGETYAALKSATLLKRSVPDEPVREMNPEILNDAAEAVASGGLLRAAFWTRVADISRSLTINERAQWLSAIVTAEDSRSLLSHEWLKTGDFGRIVIGGEPIRQNAYMNLMARTLGDRAVPLDDEIVRTAATTGAVYLGRLAKSQN